MMWCMTTGRCEPLRRRLDRLATDQRAALQVERRAQLLIHQTLDGGGAVRLVEVGDVDERNITRDHLVDDLKHHPAVLRESGTQHFVALDQLGERPLERIEIGGLGQAVVKHDVVRPVAGRQLRTNQIRSCGYGRLVLHWPRRCRTLH